MDASPVQSAISLASDLDKQLLVLASGILASTDPGASMIATSPESSEGSIYVMGRTGQEYERLRRRRDRGSRWYRRLRISSSIRARCGNAGCSIPPCAPLALKHSATTEERSREFFEEMREIKEHQSYLLCPLLISAWSQKPGQSI
jgi:hypothetical protein